MRAAAVARAMQVVLPPGYLAAVYAVMRDAGVVCVADEVQTGFGRVGDAFWAFQLQGVVPDIVTMGKPIGEGSLLQRASQRAQWAGTPCQRGCGACYRMQHAAAGQLHARQPRAAGTHHVVRTRRHVHPHRHDRTHAQATASLSRRW